MGVNGTGIAEIIIVPHRIQNLLPGQSDSLILQKIGQQLKFLIAQLHRLSVNRGNVGSLVDLNASRT